MVLFDDIGKLINMIYELESNSSFDWIIMNEDFQIQKLFPGDDYILDENGIYPILYYRDKMGNEILVDRKNNIMVKLKNKETISFNNIENFLEEKKYIEETIEYLKMKTKIKK